MAKPFNLDQRVPDGRECGVDLQSKIRAKVGIAGLSCMKVNYHSSQTPPPL